AYLKTYSPYHNLSQDTAYPRVLFTTSTRDDRVHPAHARKMVAKMQAMGHDVLYYENMEGGHAGASNNATRAAMYARTYTYLASQLALRTDRD
ncbi:prolyl oligopeptidase family serine peptidase, partial [Flavonifractor plautii]|uniref:prolyl oligopeptidase family serine peptidase n=1 Tax=Flavonifractor plautii TaxID=292800 RepID=UPI003D7E57BA